MASRTERRYYPNRPNHYRNMFMSHYIGKRARSGILGTGIGSEPQKHRDESGGDNPFVSLLLLLAFLTFCFIMSVPVLLLIRLLQ